jgi:ABC-type antimicrobial peptide transport system permease subunit
VKYASVRDQAEPTLYVVGRYMNRESVVIATTLANPATLIPLIRAEVEKLDPLIPLDFELLPQVVSGSLSRQRLGMFLMLLFGIAAVALAGVGVYGVIAYAVSQRIREMATRVALGATSGQVFWLTFRQAQITSITGVIVGLVVAYPSGRLLASSLYQVHAADPAVLAGAVALVFAFALVAIVIPSRRAARVDPMIALRAE